MWSLTSKLSLAFVCVSLLGILFVAIFTNRTIDTQSQNFGSSIRTELVAERIVTVYEDNNGWPARGNTRGLLPRPDAGWEWVVTDAEDNVIFGTPRELPRRIPPDILASGTALESGGEQIGTLVFRQEQGRGQGQGRGPQPENGSLQRKFLQDVQSNLLRAGVLATGLSLVLGALIARGLTKPLKQLTAATKAVAQGNLDQKVTVQSGGEIGVLAESFNQMNTELAQARDLRRQMTADIAHDLRTPLSIILGHSEGLKDGVLPADDETFHIIHDEALRLNRLVDDLRTLSLADAGELPLVTRAVAPHTLLERAVSAHTPRAQLNTIQLTWQADEGLPDVDVDPDRLAQVLDNLVSNAIRHTPEGGKVELNTRLVGNQVAISVRDSGEGISPDALEHMFDRFYRADKSRQRHAGGSGLGLAIVKSLVEQHGGSVSATSALNEGTTFIIYLPTA